MPPQPHQQQSLKAPLLRPFLQSRFELADRAAPEPVARTDALLNVVESIATGCAGTAVALRTTLVQKVKATNEFGDDVLTADLVADQRICDALRACDNVAAYASEEHPELTTLRPAKQEGKKPAPPPRFTVTFDPLDGSSIIDTNFSVGSIFAVWNGGTCIGQRVADIALSAVAVYGPRTTLFVAHKCFGVFEFLLTDEAKSEWRVVRSAPFDVKAKTKYFSPGNLRAANAIPAYREFLKDAVRKKLTLRYTGGMVPDVTQILIKGSGVFATPAAGEFKVKLRVCFECGPLAHMITCAGGRALDEAGAEYDAKVVEKMDQRSGVVLGSADAVADLKGALKPTAPGAPKAKL